MSDDLNFVLKARREKLDALRAASIEPFAYSYPRDRTAAEALLDMPAGSDGHEEGPRVSLAGRVIAWRLRSSRGFERQDPALLP